MIEKFKNNKSINHSELIAHWRANPVIAAKDILGVKLDIPQQIQLNAWWTHDTSTSIFTRGGGKTFSGAVWCTLQGLLYPGQRVGIIGPAFRQSKYCFGEVEKLYEKSPMFQEACAKPPTRQPESCIVKFDAAPGKVGSTIEALPMGTDGAKIRGARYYRVFVDEAAQVEAQILDTVVSGFMATLSDPMERVEEYDRQMALVREGKLNLSEILPPESNKLVQASTAYFQYNHLWTQRVSPTIKAILQDKYNTERSNGSMDRFKLQGGELNGGQIPFRYMSNGTECLLAFPYTDMHPVFLDRKRILATMAKMSEYQARQEYSCYFPPDSEGFYRRSLLDMCRAHKLFTCQPGPRKGMIYVLGIDPARSGDNFTLALFEVDLSIGCINLVRIGAWNKKSFPHMHNQIRTWVQHYDVKHIGMDAGGGGTAIRDLLANKENCPYGQKLILERDFDEHMPLVGDRILYPLIQFSSADWTHDANFALLSALQHGKLNIASKPNPDLKLIWTPEVEEFELELEEALQEWSSIVVMPSGNRMRWDTPVDGMRKDRYSAILIGHWIARIVLDKNNTPDSLAGGGWA